MSLSLSRVPQLSLRVGSTVASDVEAEPLELSGVHHQAETRRKASQPDLARRPPPLHQTAPSPSRSVLPRVPERSDREPRRDQASDFALRGLGLVHESSEKVPGLRSEGGPSLKRPKPSMVKHA